MSNNQKAVKNNPSDSKNVIRLALLRIRLKVFVNALLVDSSSVKIWHLPEILWFLGT